MKFAYRKMAVLLVDTVAVGTLEECLKDFQFYRVWTAKTGEEALEILRDDEKHVELMISSAKLKPMSGFQLLEKVRAEERWGQLLLLLMLERKEKELEEKAVKMGVNGFINLPLDCASVASTVEEILEPFVDEDEEKFLSHMHEARVAARKKKWAQAEAKYRAALAVKSTEEAQLGLARSLRQSGDLENAEQAFISCLKLNPKSLRAFLGLASVYQALGRHEDALKVLSGALNAARQMEQTGSVTSSIYFYMGEIELQLKHLNEAMGYFNKAAEELPKDSDVNVRAGDALVDHGHFEESEEFYSRALEMDPGLAHVYNKLGIAYRRQKKFDLALTLYQKALAFHPEDENLIYNIARCYFDDHQYDEAWDSLEKALELNKGFEEAKQLLAAVQKKLAGKGGPGKAEGAKPDKAADDSAKADNDAKDVDK